jgi:SAM-dependent methyltransferase
LQSTELASRLNADLRGTRILADALVSLDLLRKDGSGYENGPLVKEYLLADSPRSKVALLHHSARQYERWAGLLDAVVEGTPVEESRVDPRLSADPKAFARAMDDVGRESAGKTADALPLGGIESFLDLGGGPGAYAIEVVSRCPDIRATVLDTAETLEVTHRRVERAGLEGRVRLLAADAFVDDLGGPYDLILLSNVVHIYSPADNRKLIKRCAGELTPGGRLAVKDFLLDEERLEPRGGLLFAVNMLVSTEGGDAYTAAEVESWAQEAGLSLESQANLTVKSSIAIFAAS